MPNSHRLTVSSLKHPPPVQSVSLTGRANDGVLLTPKQMDQADKAAITGGLSGFDMMASAGKAVAEAIASRWQVQPILVLCGPGNNGGDGFVAATQLKAKGWPVRLALLGSRENLAGDAARHARLWQGNVEVFSPELLGNCSLVVDAIFGSGLSRPPEGKAREMIEALIASRTPVCAVDVPSGLDGATGAAMGLTAQAEMTVTFFRKKPGHLLFPGRGLCGKLVLADIGTPVGVLQAIAPKTFANGPELWGEDYPWPKAESYKYTRGHALIFGGEDVTGASRLAALGAMRVGAGLVTLAAPATVFPIYAASLTSAIVRKLERDADFAGLLADKRCNAIAIGPGAGIGERTKEAVLAALATKRSVVLDADALTAFADDPTLLFRSIDGPCVLTPHQGEFSRLFDFAGDKLGRTRRAADLSGAVVLLKGSDTVIAEPGGRAVINSNAPADLATGGSGDVLTGLILGLLAQHLSPFQAASAAAWLHGEAASVFGPGLIAEDLPKCLPEVLRKLKALTRPKGDGDACNGPQHTQKPA